MGILLSWWVMDQINHIYDGQYSSIFHQVGFELMTFRQSNLRYHLKLLI